MEVETTDDRFVLTDDEVICMAARAESAWPSITPTVIPDDPQSLADAARRGARSLMARGLINASEGGTLEPALQGMLDRLLVSRVALAIYLADEALAYIPQELTVTHHVAREDGWITDVTTRAGLHYLSNSLGLDCIRAAEALVTEAFTSGLAAAEASAASFLCFAAVGPDRASALAAREGEMMLRQPGPDLDNGQDPYHTVEERSVTDPAAGLWQLLRSVGYSDE